MSRVGLATQPAPLRPANPPANIYEGNIFYPYQPFLSVIQTVNFLLSRKGVLQVHSCIPRGINDLNNELSMLTVSLSLRDGNYNFLPRPRQPGAYP